MEKKISLKPEAPPWIGAKCTAVNILPTSHPLLWLVVFFMEWKALILMYSFSQTFPLWVFFEVFEVFSIPRLSNKSTSISYISFTLST